MAPKTKQTKKASKNRYAPQKATVLQNMEDDALGAGDFGADVLTNKQNKREKSECDPDQ